MILEYVKANKRDLLVLAAVLVALTVGIITYKLAPNNELLAYGNIVKSMSPDDANINMRTYCTKWMDNGWNVPLRKQDSENLERASIVLGWITKTAYYSNDPKTSTCDCAVYLFYNNLTAQNEVLKSVSTNELNVTNVNDLIEYSTNGSFTARESDSDSIPKKCHTKALCILDPIGLADTCK